ncbi:MAG: discoidin domain-containing protein, partial [Myxococcales bacterium]|nr:discoidin domain-containing protein [Myxococcales bacterium]
MTVGSMEPSRPSRRSPVRAALVAVAVAVGLIAAPLIVEPFALAGAGDNILVPAQAQTVSTMGYVRNMLRGPLPPESDRSSALKTVWLAAGKGTIEFDFGKPTRLAALVLQAPPNDRYGVEASQNDGVTWQRIWNVEASPERGPVFRNRQTRFDPPLEVTHLRLRNEAARGTLSAISGLRAYSTVPEGWPALGQLQSPSLRAHYPWTHEFEVVSRAKFVVAVVATLFLLACSPALRRRLPERINRWLKYGAITASLVAGLCWWNLMQLTADGLLQLENYWDVYHYYMGGKYAPELGHTRLYDCYLAAEVEDGFGAHQLRRATTRDLATDELVATAGLLLESSERCKPHFSPERWEDWKQDHAFFR